MGRQKRDDTILYRIAEMYHELELTQVEIAERLRITPPTVSRMLKEAKEKKIIQITIQRPIERDFVLEEQLKESTGLRNVIVVKAAKGLELEQMRKVAAEYLYMHMKPNMCLGIGVGPTISKVVDYIPEASIEDLKVVQLVGGFSGPGEEYSHDIVQRISKKLNAKGIYLNGPIILQNADAKSVVMKELIANSEIDLYWDKCDIAVFTTQSIGSQSLLSKSGFLSDNEIDELIRIGAVGDLLGNFFDRNGNFVNHSVNSRVLSIPLESVLRIKEVILLCGGYCRFDAIEGALNTKMATTLIIDASRAQRLIKENVRANGKSSN